MRRTAFPNTVRLKVRDRNSRAFRLQLAESLLKKGLALKLASSFTSSAMSNFTQTFNGTPVRLNTPARTPLIPLDINRNVPATPTPIYKPLLIAKRRGSNKSRNLNVEIVDINGPAFNKRLFPCARHISVSYTIAADSLSKSPPRPECFLCRYEVQKDRKDKASQTRFFCSFCEVPLCQFPKVKGQLSCHERWHLPDLLIEHS